MFILQLMLDTKIKCSGVVAIFQWDVPTPPTRGLVCSPSFNKLGREWRLLLEEKDVSLEYSQGVLPVHMDVRYDFYIGLVEKISKN